jgi:formamidopyrimidine-DNA glycosylase
VPELPEVETVRRGLEARVVGRRFEHVEIGRERTVRRTSANAVIDGLQGTTLVAMGRRGKYLVGELDSGDGVMIHLRMSGQLLVDPVDSPRPPHTHVAARLSGGPDELRFVDPRTFGEVVVFDPRRLETEVPELARLGRDPVADGLDRHHLAALLAGRRRQLKALLLDQSMLAGLGNIYTDEVLHRARLHPLRTSDTLTPRQITALHAAIVTVLAEAIEAGGSTLADDQYVDLQGATGSYQEDHLAYGRAGQRCLTCGKGSIVRLSIAGRGTFVCPRCQR